MYNHTQGLCHEATRTSAPYTGDFIQTTEDSIKVWWNFGCIRFCKKISK